MIQSPLFVSTDSDTDSEFDSDNYDADIHSVDSDYITPVEAQTPVPGRRTPDIEISDGRDRVSFRVDERESYSTTNPFDENYRKKADWDPALRTSWEKKWSFVRDVVEKYESREHAEFTRPFDQFRVLLQERGIHAKYEDLWSGAPDSLTRSCDVMNMLLEDAPDLIARYAELEKLTTERLDAMERGEKATWEVAWEKRRRTELGPWGTPRVR